MSELSALLQSAYHELTKAHDERKALLDTAKRLYERVTDMASIHDDVSALLDEIETGVSSLIAKKGDADSANADLKAKATSLRDMIKAALGEGDAAASSQNLGASLGNLQQGAGSMQAG